MLPLASQRLGSTHEPESIHSLLSLSQQKRVGLAIPQPPRLPVQSRTRQGRRAHHLIAEGVYHPLLACCTVEDPGANARCTVDRSAAAPSGSSAGPQRLEPHSDPRREQHMALPGTWQERARW